MPRALSLALLVHVLGGPLAAQICKGLESFQRRPIQLFANGVFASESRAYGAGVAVGTTGPYLQFQAGSIDVDQYHAAAGTLGGSAGFQVPVNERGTAQVCPTVEVVFARGPKNINGTGQDFSEHDVTFGMTAGVTVTSAERRVAVVPTGSLGFGTAHSTLSSATGSVANSQTFGIVRAGLGLGFGHELTITPLVSYPFGPSGTSATFGITVALTFGGAHPPFIANPATSCAGLPSADSTVYDTTQVAERPRLRTAPEPRYPAVEQAVVEGRVVMELVVRSDGTPDPGSVRVIQSVDPAIDRAALRWISGASYWPACRDGRPVPARMAQPIDFCRVGCGRRMR